MPIDDYGIDFDGDGGPGRTRLLPCLHITIADVFSTPTVCADCGYVLTEDERQRDSAELCQWEEDREERVYQDACF